MTNQQSIPAVLEQQSITRAMTVLSGTVRSIVAKPDQVQVEARTDGRVTTLFLNVSGDAVRMFDPAGKTARSLRTIIAALSVRSALDMRLEIVVQTIWTTHHDEYALVEWAMQCKLGFSRADDGQLLVLTEVLGNYSAANLSRTSVSRFTDENVFLYYVVLADLDDDVTTSLIANALLVSSGRSEEAEWIRLTASDSQIRALGLSLPFEQGASEPGALGDSCDFLNDMHFRDVLMQAPTPVTMLMGPQHEFSFVNPAYIRLIGRKSAESVLGKPVREALPELQGQPFYGLLDMVYRTGKPYVGKEIPAHLKDEHTGKVGEFYFDFVYHPVRDHNGELCGILCQASDVTERVLARLVSETREAKLYHQWAELEAIYSKSPVGMTLVDVKEYRLLRINEMSAEFLAVPINQALGKAIFELFPSVEGLREIYERVAAGEEVRNVQIDVVNRPDGSPDRRLQLFFSPVLDAFGRIEAIASIAIDVTQPLEPERSLVLDEADIAEDLINSR